MKKKIFFWIVLTVLFLFLFDIFLLRTFGERELDDLSPGISCLEPLVEKSDVLWVIPLYKNESIADNEIWCNYILSFNKKIGMHGVYHSYEEFGTDKGEDYIQKGTLSFERCFGFKPTMFKPPQLEITGENRKLLEKEGFEVKSFWNQLVHKAYHCDDTGVFPNWIIDLF